MTFEELAERLAQRIYDAKDIAHFSTLKLIIRDELTTASIEVSVNELEMAILNKVRD